MVFKNQKPEMSYENCFSCALKLKKKNKKNVDSTKQSRTGWELIRFSDLLYLNGSKRKYIFLKNYIFDTKLQITELPLCNFFCNKRF